MSLLPTTTDKLEYETKKHLLEDFKTLSKEEYEEAFRIIKRDNVEYSENSNGVFFDLLHCSSETTAKLIQFFELCKTQRKNEEARTNELNTLRSETN